MSFPPGRPEECCSGGHAAPSVTVVLVTVNESAWGRRAKGSLAGMAVVPFRTRVPSSAMESTITPIIDYLVDHLGWAHDSDGALLDLAGQADAFRAGLRPRAG